MCLIMGWYKDLIFSTKVQQAEQVEQPVIIRIEITIFIGFQFCLPKSMHEFNPRFTLFLFVSHCSLFKFQDYYRKWRQFYNQVIPVK